MAGRNELQDALQLVVEAEADLALQRKIVFQLERDGHPSIGARTMQRLLEQNLQNRREMLARLIPAEPPPTP
jgi:hypothetical protein